MTHDERDWRELTAREQEVLDLLVVGKTNSEIGRELTISARTVEKHVTKIIKKLGVGSRLEAAVKALQARYS